MLCYNADDALTSKESGRSESAIVMSNTSLESVDQTKVWLLKMYIILKSFNFSTGLQSN